VLVPRGQGRCDEHTRQLRKESDESRLSARERGYDTRWQKARKVFLAEHPLCAECLKDGRYTPANIVDHIEPHKGDPVKFWDEANWAALCSACHSTKSAREDGSFGNPRRGVKVI
jgi:5-methylcytosine-specific restriction protein A